MMRGNNKEDIPNSSSSLFSSLLNFFTFSFSIWPQGGCVSWIRSHGGRFLSLFLPNALIQPKGCMAPPEGPSKSKQKTVIEDETDALIQPKGCITPPEGPSKSKQKIVIAHETDALIPPERPSKCKQKIVIQFETDALIQPKGYITPPERPSKSKQKIVIEDEVDVKYRSFKHFDTVRDHSDHYYSKPKLPKLAFGIKKPPSKDWLKRILHEWKVLEKDLPETIYVRVYEDRMDLLRAVIIGPAGTPYHDGLFFFDVCFPSNYPQVPPKVHYHSGGLRLNPNLYACGKVCLSLLNTWSGSGCEKWNPSNSTMLQVLVSIQALVLNAKPYFNEPGYSKIANTPDGERKSLRYNKEAFLLSCKTMLYSLRRPQRHFEELVAGHFRKHGHFILVACLAYMHGAQVGRGLMEAVEEADGSKSCSRAFKSSLKKLYEDLLVDFIVKGVDCDDFLPQKVKDAVARAVGTTSKLQE